MVYADYAYYSDIFKGSMSKDDAEKQLKQASRHIDTLTFNRIVASGFDKLTSFQREVVQECCCMMADFEHDNADLINNLLSSYSLNGASLSFSGDSTNATVVNGVCVQRDTYEYLKQSGLCCRSMGV